MAKFMRTFRRHRKLMLAVLTLLAMFSFVFLDILYRSSGSSGPRNPVAVQTAKYGPLSERQLEVILQQRRWLYGFLERVRRAVIIKGGRGENVRLALEALGHSPANEEAAVESWLLTHRAEELGLQVNRKAINDYLALLGEGRLSNDDLKQILRDLRLSQSQLFEALRQELLARRLEDAFRISLIGTTPAQRWEYYRQLHRKAKIEAAPILVNRFLNQVAEPSEETLRAFFEEHKDRLPDPNSAEPGLREPHRIDLEYLKADYEQFVKTVTVSDKEIEEFYQANKERLYKDILPEGPKAKPAADEAKKPEGGKAEAKPAASPKAEADKPQPGVQPSPSASKADAPQPASKPAAGQQPSQAEPRMPAPKTEAGKGVATEAAGAGGPSEKPKGTGQGGGQAGEPTQQPAPSQPASPSTPNQPSSKAEPSKTGTPSSGVPSPAPPAAERSKADSPQPKAGSSSGKSGDGLFRLVSDPGSSATQPAKKPPESPTKGEPPSKPQPAVSAPPGAPAPSVPTTSKPESKPVSQPESPKKAEAAAKPSQVVGKAEPALGKGETLTGQAATGSAVASEPVKYIPLDKVRDEIHKTLARQKAQEKIKEVLRRILDRMAKFEQEWTFYETLDPKEKATKAPPARLDLEALAKAQGLTAGRTGLMTAWEVRGLDLGGSQTETGASLIEVAFEKNFPLYRPATSQDTDGNNYLFWKVGDQPERVPEFDEPGQRQRALEAWKVVQARSLALQEAERLADQARKAGKPLSEVFAGRSDLKVLTPEPFTWLTFGTLPVWFRRIPPRYSEVAGIEGAGPEFMRAVFALQPGQIGLATNEPKSAVYVVRLVEYVPAESVLWDMFVSDDYGTYESAARYDQSQASRIWREQLKAEAGLTWQREPFRGRVEAQP